MKLKTATLIALIGASLNAVLHLGIFLIQNVFEGIRPQVFMAYGIATLLLSNGSIILFFYVLYRKQSD